MFNISNYNKIIQEIADLGKKTEIVAVSKNHPKSSVEEALSFGLRIFGENRVQEALSKFTSIKQKYKNLQLHLTGPLQTNKVKQALSIFDVFHTLDREKLAKEFIKHEKSKEKKFFIQVNTGKEINKSGVYLENLDGFVDYCLNELKLNIIGLMCIPPIDEDPKKHFSVLKERVERLKLQDLSIGMSSDYKQAITYNAKYIRIGTALFGNRNQ
tara:strand:+ start:25133 stop:25771 length:639 start_codon:yes stop_codon:yes gene_type:complete